MAPAPRSSRGKSECGRVRLRFRGIDVNRASLELLYRVPGLGVRAAKKIVAARRYQKLRLADVGRLTVSIARIRPFITALDWHPGGMLDRENLRAQLAPAPAQLSLL